jgi:hypothetical protein
MKIFAVTWRFLTTSSEITLNAISLCFTKKFTTATYGIGIGRIRCLWKAFVKYHSIFFLNYKKKIKPGIACPNHQKPKFGFKEFWGLSRFLEIPIPN